MIKLVELFSGIGAQSKALQRLGVPFQVVGYSEIDKFAIRSYIAIHGEQPALGDIENITELPTCDIMTYSSPCQDFSVAGDKKGLIDEQGNKTRSGLLLDVERLLENACRNNNLPKVLLMENVKNLVGTKFKPDFDRWLETLDKFGYNNYWKVLNAQDYGIPQHRQRVFVVSIRKDIGVEYKFPEPIPLTKTIKDMLEYSVPESYYLNQHTLDKIAKSKFHSERDRIIKGNVSLTLRARDYKDPLCVQVPVCGASRGRYVYDENGNKRTEQQLELNGTSISNTLTTIQTDSLVIEPPFRVRKLTERECWRLMGFSDDDIDKVKAIGMSKSQMYKQAGNSIVVDVLYYIFRNLPLDKIESL